MIAFSKTLLFCTFFFVFGSLLAGLTFSTLNFGLVILAVGKVGIILLHDN